MAYQKLHRSACGVFFVPTERIEEIAETQGATPFDAPKVKLGHRNGKCSFETIIEEYDLKDRALQELAKIVHSADTKDIELAPEGLGLSAVMTGSRFNVKDDFEAVQEAVYVYDALYSYCQFQILCKKYEQELKKMEKVGQRNFLMKKIRSKTKNRKRFSI